MKKRASAKTPIRKALKNESSLKEAVCDGLNAVENGHKGYIDDSLRSAFGDSIELDKAMLKGREQENRWDYLLGHSDSGAVVALEPHSAKQDQITTVVRKRAAAREQLREHLKDGIVIAKWLWVASGTVQFADTERARRLLDQNGIEFVGTKVLRKHLPK